MGGGTRRYPISCVSLRGLSPRGRGNRWRSGVSVSAVRSIPPNAWAGEPGVTPSRAYHCAVYPRVGGGTVGPSGQGSDKRHPTRSWRSVMTFSRRPEWITKSGGNPIIESFPICVQSSILQPEHFLTKNGSQSCEHSITCCRWFSGVFALAFLFLFQRTFIQQHTGMLFCSGTAQSVSSRCVKGGEKVYHNFTLLNGLSPRGQGEQGSIHASIAVMPGPSVSATPSQHWYSWLLSPWLPSPVPAANQRRRQSQRPPPHLRSPVRRPIVVPQSRRLPRLPARI